MRLEEKVLGIRRSTEMDWAESDKQENGAAESCMGDI